MNPAYSLINRRGLAVPEERTAPHAVMVPAVQLGGASVQPLWPSGPSALSAEHAGREDYGTTSRTHVRAQTHHARQLARYRNTDRCKNVVHLIIVSFS